MSELLLFSSTFVLVFALGLQSLNVNGGHYVAACVTSLVIGSANLVVLRIAPTATWTEIAAYLLGGPLGIMASMAMHGRLVRKVAKADAWAEFREVAEAMVRANAELRIALLEADLRSKR